MLSVFVHTQLAHHRPLFTCLLNGCMPASVSEAGKVERKLYARGPYFSLTGKTVKKTNDSIVCSVLKGTYMEDTEKERVLEKTS